MQNHYRDYFHSDTKKNLKDCMTITLRSDKEVQVRKEAEKRWKVDETERKSQNKVGSENEQHKIEHTYESEKLKVSKLDD